MPKSEHGFSSAIEYYREDDGRWLADIAALPGVTAYGRTRKQATASVQALALRLIADRREHGERWRHISSNPVETWRPDLLFAYHDRVTPGPRNETSCEENRVDSAGSLVDSSPGNR